MAGNYQPYMPVLIALEENSRGWRKLFHAQHQEKTPIANI